MDFALVLERITGFLDRSAIRHALVGGHALVALGISRTTIDLDLIVEASIQDDLISFLELEGYETLHSSNGFSNHAHSDPRLGRVDLIYIRGATAEQVFQACEVLPGPGGRPIAVPKPEHLVAMKLHAIQNDASRRLRDLADIRSLVVLPGVERGQVREQFTKRELLHEWQEIARDL